MNPVISREYIKKNYIHKDKVRELLERIDGCLEGCYMAELDFNVTGKIYAYDNCKEMIKELLEETEDENNNTITMQKQEEQSTDSNKQ